MSGRQFLSEKLVVLASKGMYYIYLWNSSSAKYNSASFFQHEFSLNFITNYPLVFITTESPNINI